jgi:hypothetical protein
MHRLLRRVRIVWKVSCDPDGLDEEISEAMAAMPVPELHRKGAAETKKQISNALKLHHKERSFRKYAQQIPKQTIAGRLWIVEPGRLRVHEKRERAEKKDLSCLVVLSACESRMRETGRLA